MYDLIIIGAGPAGLTSAIYATRAGLSTLVLEKTYAGGQMTTTSEIDNYPGFQNISGFELSMKMADQAKALGAEIRSAEVLSVDFCDGENKIHLKNETLTAKTVILASGASRRKLSVDGEEALLGKGVSYCATCDGGFFKGRDVCIVGGGNTALEDALYLAKICRKVYLIHRRDEFRGFDAFVKAINLTDTIVPVLNSTVEKIGGDEVVSSVTVKNVKTGELSEIETSACFIAVGSLPNTELFKDSVTLTPDGYIAADESTKTNLPGVFAAGDIRKKISYQIVTACSDGAVAAHMAGIYLSEKDK